jgi:hypothetical protein
VTLSALGYFYVLHFDCCTNRPWFGSRWK